MYKNKLKKPKLKIAKKVKQLIKRKVKPTNNRQLLKMEKAIKQASQLNRAAKYVPMTFTPAMKPTTTYQQSIMRPELMLKAQIPRQFGQVTLPLSRHLTIPVVTNVLGNMFIAYQPYALCDNSNNYTTFYLNNSPTYDGATTLGVATALGVAHPYSIPAGNVQSYSLVSASMTVQPQNNWSTITGKLGFCSILLAAGNNIPPGSAAGAFINTLAIQTFAFIENQAHYNEANLQNSQSARIIYTVADIHDFEKFGINSPEGVTAENETTFLLYATGCPASAKFNVEIYLNFEVTVQPGSALAGLGKPCTSIEDPAIVHTKVSNSPMVCQAIQGFTRGPGMPFQALNPMQSITPAMNHNPVSHVFGASSGQLLAAEKQLGHSLYDTGKHKNREEYYAEIEDLFEGNKLINY